MTLLLTPLLFCAIAAGLQHIIQQQLTGRDFRCGCQCTSCCDWSPPDGLNPSHDCIANHQPPESSTCFLIDRGASGKRGSVAQMACPGANGTATTPLQQGLVPCQPAARWGPLLPCHKCGPCGSCQLLRPHTSHVIQARNSSRCGLEYSTAQQAPFCPVEQPPSWPPLLQVRCHFC